MGFFDFLFKKTKPAPRTANANIKQLHTFNEIKVPPRTEPQPPFLNIDKEQIVATGFKAFYKNGVLFNVQPRNKTVSLDDDRQTAYDAQYIISNDVLYDLESAESISSIAIPNFCAQGSMPYTTRDLSYILKMRVGVEKRPHLAVPLAYKVANLMIASPIGWTKKDYYRLVIQLWSIGEIAYGDYLLEELKSRLPFVAKSDPTKYSVQNLFMSALNDARRTDYLEIPHEICVCEKCAPYVNRIYNISGRDNRFPILPQNIIENKGLHCNVSFYRICFYEGMTISHYEFDKNGNCKTIEKDAITQSNRPFRDNRSLFEKENYIAVKEKEEKQKEQEEQYYNKDTWVEKFTDRLEYYNIVKTLGSKAPKSFAGFVRIKNKNTASYQKLLSLIDKHS